MLSSLAWGQAQAQDTLWVRFDNRFKANVSMPIQNVDSIEVTPSKLRFYNATLPLGYSEKTISSFAPIDESEMSFVNPGRYLLKPSTYAGTDYTNAAATSGYNFAHSQESEHYALFWDVRYGEDPNRLQYPGDGNVASAKQILNICERSGINTRNWDSSTLISRLRRSTRFSFMCLISRNGVLMLRERRVRTRVRKRVLVTSILGLPTHEEVIPWRMRWVTPSNI